MLIEEFYRQAIAKIEKKIRAAKLKNDFKTVSNLMKEKADWQERARQDNVSL